MIDTKQRILDTAERLIADQGYAATSLRHIIGEAGVNLAAVHYHFGSKEDLLDQLILAKAKRVNAERLALLERFEAESGGGPVPIEKVLAAFFEPMIEAGSKSPQFVRLMGRMYAEGLLPTIVAKHFHPTLVRFMEALRRSLPHLGEAELSSRLQFMIGAMSHAVSSRQQFSELVGELSPADFRSTMRRLMVFLSGGLQAPPTPEVSE
jgi:AcrR family transcriptional regulator